MHRELIFHYYYYSAIEITVDETADVNCLRLKMRLKENLDFTAARNLCNTYTQNG